MRSTRISSVCAWVAALSWSTAAVAQFTELVTHFETNREDEALPFQPASFGDLQVVMFQDPAEADVTFGQVVADVVTTSGLPWTEESFVANFVSNVFFGAEGSDQFMDIRFEWTDPADADRWVLVETFQSPLLGDPSIHLDGQVRMRINFPFFTSEFPDLLYTPRIGVALLVRETGNDVPQGFRDGGEGALEFVGVTSVGFAETANPIPRPARFFDGPTGGEGDDGWVSVTFDLDAESIVGWEFEGGDGVLDASTNGDMVNRGVLAGLVLTVDAATDTTSEYVEFLVDRLELDAPVVDPTYPPTIDTPVIQEQTTVRVKDVLSSSTDVTLEIDRVATRGTPFDIDESLSVDPAGALYMDFSDLDPLTPGDRLRAKQTNPSGTSAYSIEIEVSAAATFSFCMTLDENGDLGAAPADFEFVGASSVVSGAPQGKPVFTQTGVWQNVEISLVPGVEDVIDFAGGDGALNPDGGLYNIDAIWFSIDPTEPNAGPYDVFVDHVYYIDVDDNEVLISDAESVNPFPLFRGQTTATVSASSALSGLASFDGSTSNRIQWEWQTAATDNTIAPFRPQRVFEDSAKAVGYWLLVEDIRTSGVALPDVVPPIIGDAPGVTVEIGTNGVVELFINGASVAVETNGLAPSVDFDLSALALVVGDQLTATLTTGAGTSDISYPRGVSVPPAPSIAGPLFEGQAAVIVQDVLTLPFATATTVTVYDGDTVLGTGPGGTASVSVSVSPALVALQEITATQTVNGVESQRSGALQVLAQELPNVVINEFVYDDTGGDDREFVEVYNADTNSVDVSGWVLRASDTVAPPGDNNPDYTIPAGTILVPGQFYVLGTATVPDVDQIVGVTNLWENDNEALQLVTSDGFVVETVIYELNKGAVAVSPAEGGLWGNMISEDATVASHSRFLDGRDTGRNGRDFGTRAATPGATNNAATVFGYAGPDVDSLLAGALAPGFHGSFVAPTVIDPTVADGFNPSAIPASPSGGNAVILWDPSGGGDMGGSNFTIDVDGFYDIWLYLDAGTNSIEEWNIGLAGSADYWAHNLLYNGANGSSGVSWTYQRSATGAVLRLTDHGAGGPPGTWNTLGTVDVSGSGAGWHRLAIYLCGSKVTGIYDDTVIIGTTEAGILGNFYVGYRESATGTIGVRPPTFDFRAQPDCNSNGVGDGFDIGAGTSTDCNCSTVPDECEALGDGDFDGDGDADIDDYADMADCLAGPGVPPAPARSECVQTCLDAFDFDGDGDVDLSDFAQFSLIFTG